MARRRLLDGVENVERMLGAMPRESAERIAHALNLGAKEIARDAETLVPRDTGDLANTIDVKTAGVRGGARGLIATVVAGTSRETANAAFRSEHGRAPSPDGHPGHSPHPFMFPAYWRNRQRALGRVKRALKAAAKSVSRRG